MIAPAAGIAVTATVVAIVVALTSGKHDAAPGSRADPRAPATGESGCPKSAEYRPGVEGEVDYVSFVYFHGYAFLQDYSHRRRDVSLGPTVAKVTCTMANLPPNRHYLSPVKYHDGNAAFLPVGMPLHRVPGFSGECRLAVRWQGRTVQFLAQVKGIGTFEPRACAQHPRR
jgi:hypothetical protein